MMRRVTTNARPGPAQDDPAVPVLVLGCGYTGTRIALRERDAGHAVLVTTRGEERRQQLADLGLDARCLDLDRTPLPAWLAGAAAGALVYYLVAPPREGERDPRARAAAAALGAVRPRQVVLISTTAVYGDCAGEWVDESRPPRPGSARGRRRLDAERAFRDALAGTGVALSILRVAGIYGPRRLPFERLSRGDPVLEPGAAPYSNRIHVDDLVRACRAAGRLARACEVFNAADGNPTTMTDYFFQAADALGLPRPPAIDVGSARERLGAGMLEYLGESKRIDSRRLGEVLDAAPRFTDLGSALAQAAASYGAAAAAFAPSLVVCINRRVTDKRPSCAVRGSEALAAQLEEGMKRRALGATLRRVYCLGSCESGPNVRIAPGGPRYSEVTPGDCDRILRELAQFIDEAPG